MMHTVEQNTEKYLHLVYNHVIKPLNVKNNQNYVKMQFVPHREPPNLAKIGQKYRVFYTNYVSYWAAVT
jgi:hypothetical protein